MRGSVEPVKRDKTQRDVSHRRYGFAIAVTHPTRANSASARFDQVYVESAGLRGLNYDGVSADQSWNRFTTESPWENSRV